MKIRYAALLVLLLCALGASAQTTSTTATIVDTDGSVWINAPYTISIVSPIPPVTSPGNQPFTDSFTGTTNGSGALSVTLQRVANIFPANTTWRFCVSPAVTPQTYCVNVPVGNSGQSSEDVSSQINAVIQPPRLGGSPMTLAYADAEVTATGGSQYYNVTSNVFRCYTTSWGNCNSGSGGSVTWPATGDVVISNSTSSPTGLAPVNGDCIVGAGGAWTAGSCGSGGSVSITSSTGDLTVSPSPLTGTGTIDINPAHTTAYTVAQTFSAGANFGPASALLDTTPSNTYLLAGKYLYDPSGSVGFTVASYGQARFNALVFGGLGGLFASAEYTGSAEFVAGTTSTAGLGMTDSAVSDTLLAAPSGKSIRIGTYGSSSTIQVSSAGFTMAATAPSGACTTAGAFQLTQDGAITRCLSSTWTTFSGGGSTAFSALTGGTNTMAAMLVGTGGSLGPTGSGAVTANAYSGLLPVANGGLGAAPTAASQVFVSSSTTAGAWSTTPAFSGASITALSATNVSTGTLASARGGTGISNTATLTLGTSNQNWASLGTGIVKNTTTTGAISDAAAADVYGLWTGTCSSSTYLRGDGACAAPSGSGTVNSGTATQIGYYASTGTAMSGDPLLTDNGTTLAYTGTGGISATAGITSAGDGTHAGMISIYPNTTVPTLTTGDFSILGPNSASITAFAWQAPTSQASAGLLHVGAPSSAVSQMTVSLVGIADLSATGTPSSSTYLRGDNTWASGSSSPLTITGSGMTTGNVYYAASGGLTAAEANVSTTVPGICYATSATTCQINGTVATTGLTAGAIYYISDSSAGALTATAPTTSGHFVQRFGVALSTTVLLIDPSLDVGGVQ